MIIRSTRAWRSIQLMGKTAVDKVVALSIATRQPQTFVLHAIPGNAIAENQSAVTCSDSKQTG